LRGGDAWDASIRRQIKDCALFVPIISTNTQARSEGYFRLEWKLAVDRSHLMADDQAFLLPVVIDATMDASARVPEKFRDVQWTHLRGGAAATAFAEHVQRLLSGSAAPASVALPLPVAATASTVAADSQGPPSIAVLPFVNMSRNEEDEYFADGLAEELLNVLAKIRGLRVAARTSSFQFKGKNDDIAVIGRKLNVATVLEGSVRKAGNRMRIAVQLVKVADGYHLWSETYDRTLEDIFAVQDDIAQSVVKELRTTLLGEAADAKAEQEVTAQVAAAAKGRATDPEAHRLYLQARHLIDRTNRDDTARGINYLKQALDLDPAFALAWAELVRAYTIEAGQGWTPVAEGYARAREAVARALVLEPELAEGHAQMGWIQMYHDWDWHGAEASFRRARELAPGNAGVLRRAGVLAGNFGRIDEAIAFDRRALEQDPLSAAVYNNLGIHLNANGRLAEAEAAYRKALELAPQRISAHAHLSLNLLAQGRAEEALAEALREPEEWARLWTIAIIQHAANRRDESEATLQELIAKHAMDSAYQVAMVYAVRGETDLAFSWIEQANVQREAGLSEMKPEPILR
jgi:TolB-like protein/Tfp pilus assembly protein PilF